MNDIEARMSRRRQMLGTLTDPVIAAMEVESTILSLALGVLPLVIFSHGAFTRTS